MMPQDVFDRLLQESRAGSKEAWGELLTYAYPFMVETARRLTKRKVIGRDRPSDLVQAGYVRAFEKGVQFAGHSQAELEAWLARLLGNLHANHVRDLSRWREDEHLEQIVAHGREAKWHVEARETFRLLLRLLSDEEKVVIGLWIGGWTWNEIGDVLGISAEAARKRKDRAIPDLVKGFLRAGEPRWRLVRN